MKGLLETRQRIAKRISSEANDTEKWLRALAGNSTIGVYVVQDGKFQFVNYMFQKYVGYSEDQLVGMDSLSIVHPEDRDMVRENAVKMLKGEYSSPYEFRYVNKGGECLWVMETVTSIQYQGRRASMGNFMDITEKKRAKEKYRQLLEDMNEGYVVIHEGKYVFANSRFGAILGYEPEQIVGMSIGQFLAPGDHQAAMELYEKAMRGEEAAPEQYEALVIKKDESKTIVEVNAKAVEYDGKPAFAVIVRDISERKQSEEELIAAQKYAHTLIDRSLDMIISVDQERRIVEFNLAAQKAFGYRKDEVMGKHVNILYDNPEDGFTAHETARRTGQFTGEIINKRKNGDTFISFLAASALLNEEGEYLGIMGVSRDITKHKKAQAILRESEEKLRLIFESVPEGIVVTDLEGRILDVNEGAVHMHGYDAKEELIGQTVIKLIAERDHAMATRGRKNVLEGVSPGVSQYRLIRKNGSEFTATWRAAVLKDAAGQPAGFVAVAIDITEQQKMQEQLMLADRLASIGQLAAGIAHELNNPLAGVIGFSELLLEKDLPGEVREDLETIDMEAKRAANVVKGLLTFVRKKGTEKALMDINSIIQDVLRLRSYEQRVSNIEVDALLVPDLFPVIGNGAQMEQVFMNLILNAEQAMIEAHGRGRLKVTTKNAGEMVQVSISDDGPGILPENMKKLFTPFFTTKEVGKGTGLGLSICHGIVTEHSGRIYAESEPGKGTSFIVEMPIPAIGGKSDGRS